MNERIKQLMQQANLQPYYDRQEDDIGKFAELIIRECAEIALREDHEPSECILAHFGVK